MSHEPPIERSDAESDAARDSAQSPNAEPTTPTTASGESAAGDQDTRSPAQAAAKGSSGDADDAIEQAVISVLRTCYDPEIPVDIYELGLIYEVDVRPDASVRVRMTLTSPMCPVAESLPPEVEAKVANAPGVRAAEVEVVWDPPWNPEMMSEGAKLQLGMM